MEEQESSLSAQDETLINEKSPQSSNDLSELFRDIDQEFIGINKVEDEVFTYQGSDVLVQSSFELPIIVQWPRSAINFEFSTTPVRELNNVKLCIRVKFIKPLGRYFIWDGVRCCIGRGARS